MTRCARDCLFKTNTNIRILKLILRNNWARREDLLERIESLAILLGMTSNELAKLGVSPRSIREQRREVRKYAEFEDCQDKLQFVTEELRKTNSLNCVLEQLTYTMETKNVEIENTLQNFMDNNNLVISQNLHLQNNVMQLRELHFKDQVTIAQYKETQRKHGKEIAKYQEVQGWQAEELAKNKGTQATQQQEITNYQKTQVKQAEEIVKHHFTQESQAKEIAKQAKEIANCHQIQANHAMEIANYQEVQAVQADKIESQTKEIAKQAEDIANQTEQIANQTEQIANQTAEISKQTEKIAKQAQGMENMQILHLGNEQQIHNLTRLIKEQIRTVNDAVQQIQQLRAVANSEDTSPALSRMEMVVDELHQQVENIIGETGRARPNIGRIWKWIHRALTCCRTPI